MWGERAATIRSRQCNIHDAFFCFSLTTWFVKPNIGSGDLAYVSFIWKHIPIDSLQYTEPVPPFKQFPAKAIALNSVEIQIVRTNAKTQSGEFPHQVIGYLMELLL